MTAAAAEKEIFESANVGWDVVQISDCVSVVADLERSNDEGGGEFCPFQTLRRSRARRGFAKFNCLQLLHGGKGPCGILAIFAWAHRLTYVLALLHETNQLDGLST